MVECPYCFKEQEVCHDDGFGYEENTLWEEECNSCGKMFVFETYISFDHTGYKAPCLNGVPHIWEKRHGAPAWYFVNKRQCKDCDAQKDIKKGEPGYENATCKDGLPHLPYPGTTRCEYCNENIEEES